MLLAMSPRTVPLVNLAAQNAELRSEIDGALAAVIDSGQFILGPFVAAFETELAAHCQARHAVGVSSGTDALLLSLMAAEVGPGDEVITSAFSFFATAGVVARLGATPVFADIDLESFNLHPKQAEAKVSDRTKAVMPVNLYGRLADLPDCELPIIEDAAQSIGTGTARGLAACYSFFPTKNVGALGDAGAVTTNDDAFADRLRLLRTHGGRPKYVHKVLGGNFRLDALQAAVLSVKLKRDEEWRGARRANADLYRSLAAQAKLPSELVLPRDSPEHVYHQFTIRAPRRDALQAYLKEKGVGSLVYYPKPLHLQECFASLGYGEGSLPNTERAAREALSLPIHPHLAPDDQTYVVESIAAFYAA